MCSKEVKMMILNEIDKNKFILFGSYTDKRAKAFTWESIFQKAWLQGAYQNKTWRYLRDAAWPNMRKCTLIKIEKSQKVDQKHGYLHQFTDVDNKIMQILQVNVKPVVKNEPQCNIDTGQIEVKVQPQYNSHPNEIQQAKIQPQYNNSHHDQIQTMAQSQEPSKNEETETVKEEPTTNYVEESSSSTSSTIDEMEEETQLKENNIIITNINEDETSSPESKRKKRSNQMAELKCEKLKLEIEILKRNKSTSELDMENKRIENKILSLQLMKLEYELGVRSSQD